MTEITIVNPPLEAISEKLTARKLCDLHCGAAFIGSVNECSTMQLFLVGLGEVRLMGETFAIWPSWSKTVTFTIDRFVDLEITIKEQGK